MGDQSGKAEYHKPTVLRIELKTEEVMSTGCKTQTGQSTASAGARPCRISPCGPIGS